MIIPDVGRQQFVAQMLNDARGSILHDALDEACRTVHDPVTLRSEITVFAPVEGLKALQGSGVRDEEVFATPSLLKAKPQVLGYYRLLLGVSRKQFYKHDSGLSPFISMEDDGVVSEIADALLPQLCKELDAAMSKLVVFINDADLAYDTRFLPVMTLGAQADGAWRNAIGAKATRDVFEALTSIVKETNHKYEQTSDGLSLTNNSDRMVLLKLSPDPDVTIVEYFDSGGRSNYKAAIEIKGGTDRANMHNRAGEAEKSHQKARQNGAQDCWTVIHLRDDDRERLGEESPSTRQWFDLDALVKREGEDWERMKALVKSAMGI